MVPYLILCVKSSIRAVWGSAVTGWTKVALAAASVAAALSSATTGASATAQPVGTSTPSKVAHGTALSAAHPVLRFRGQMHNPTPLPTVSDPDPTVCVVDCQRWALTVHTSKRFLVAIHNTSSSID